jgi:hypothetical protein
MDGFGKVKSNGRWDFEAVEKIKINPAKKAKI